MNKAFICVFAALVAGCSVPKVVMDYQRDSVALIVRDSIVFRDSVIMVEVPQGSDKAILPDSDTSRLETDIAQSVAWVADGLLFHELRNKDAALIPVTIMVPERLHYEQKERLVYNKIVERVEVEKQLSKWQSFIMSIGYGFLIAAALWVAWKVSKLFL